MNKMYFLPGLLTCLVLASGSVLAEAPTISEIHTNISGPILATDEIVIEAVISDDGLPTNPPLTTITQFEIRYWDVTNPGTIHGIPAFPSDAPAIGLEFDSNGIFVTLLGAFPEGTAYTYAMRFRLSASALGVGTHNLEFVATDDEGFQTLAYPGPSVTVQSTIPTDSDGDGIPDDSDNCPFTANAGQSDGDGDAIGDVCDPDNDNDGVDDEIDNCPLLFNPDQADDNGDGFGDACVPVSSSVDPSADVSPSAQIGDDVQVDKNTVIGEESVIGDGTQLDKGVEVGANTAIGADVELDQNVTIGDGVMIGEGAIIGRDTCIADGATIGESAEIGRNSNIGKNAVVAPYEVLGKETMIEGEGACEP